MLEDQLTGYGVVVAASAASARLGRSLEGARVALEGFGKVGAGVARFLVREGARLVAVSNVAGGIHDDAGLDVERLLALRARHGDDGLARYEGGRRVPREALLALPADVFVPGARPDVLHRGNVGDVAAARRAWRRTSRMPTVRSRNRRGVTALPDCCHQRGACSPCSRA